MSHIVLLLFICLWLIPANSAAATKTEAGPKDFQYDGKGARDPFWRLVTPGGSVINFDGEILVSDMILEGIVVNENGANIAIINGVIVKPADEVGDYLIKAINDDAVILQKGQEVVTLKLKKED